MSPSDDLVSRLRATFAQELEEQVRAMNSALLMLEQRPGDAETIKTLFRSAHTIKGASRVVGLPLIEQTCHALESLFEQLRDQRRELSGSSFSYVFAVVDALADAASRLQAGRQPEDGELSSLLPGLSRISSGGDSAVDPAAGDSEKSTASPPALPEASPGKSVDRPRSEEVAGSAFVANPRTEAPAAETPGEDPAPEETVRIAAGRLDRLLATVGELAVTSNRLVVTYGRNNDEVRHLDRTIDELSGLVRELRLRPLQDAWEALPRAVRDAAAANGKQVKLEIAGAEVEADRAVVDALREPLLHLIRNAVVHGLEPPEERQKLGKPPVGEVTVEAEILHGRLVIRVSDDGRGLDEAAIREEMRLRGQHEPETPAEMAQAVLISGMSTSAEMTSLSGRGVGLDIVRTSLERIGGSIDVRWTSGAGTTFVLECPPSPSMMRAVQLRIGPTVFAVPSAQVDRISRVRPSQLQQIDGRFVLSTADGLVPAYSLSTLLGPPFAAAMPSESSSAVLLHVGSRRAAILVDEVFSEDEIVVRPIPGYEDAIGFALGATVLPSGSVALVLAPSGLMSSAAARRGVQAALFAAPRDTRRRTVLLADDSITTRLLEQSILETAGFAVVVAVDGMDAWKRLEEREVDVVVADVEMPRMDGFTLCRRIRESPNHASLPVVLVTGLGSPEDRARGLDAGANAYIVKSAFDQSILLDAVHELIGQE